MHVLFAYGFINNGLSAKLQSLDFKVFTATWRSLKLWSNGRNDGFSVPADYHKDIESSNVIFFVSTRENERAPMWARDDVLNVRELSEKLDSITLSRLAYAEEKPVGVESVTKMSYYNQGSIECIEAIKAALTQEEFVGWLRGTIIKYQWRLGGKNSAIEDSNKTLYYLNRLVKELQEMGLE